MSHHQTARAIWLHKASTPFRNHSWRTAVFSTVDLQGLFQNESGRSLLRLWQTVSNSVSLCFTPHQSDDLFLFFMSNFHDCRVSLLEINTCIDAGGHYVWYVLSAVV